MSKNTEVAAIYFPSWHDEPRRNAWLGDGFTEWDLIKAGKPRFDGHYQPQIPTLGYLDETLPENMQRSCDLASGAGIDAFLWDWYWYDGADFLNRPLNDTFMNLPAPGIKFALMWANHDWVGVFPGNVGETADLWWKGAVDHEEFVRMTNIVIERYFPHPEYWRVDDRAWFTIFRLNEFVNGVGGFVAAQDALEDFRARARGAGMGELHLNTMGGYEDYTPEQIAELGIDTVGTYGWTEQWAEVPPTEITFDYATWRENAEQHWHKERVRHALEFVPAVAMGWDSSTRVNQNDELVVSDWPYYPIVVNNTPEAFGEAVSDAIDFVEANEHTRVVTINAWNEWTEGSYLEPDSRTGDAHLRALAAAIDLARETSVSPK
ncbi:glycoside hydrolase family 99-like domain-containing protein [Frigoribacterium sp. UYMn621]|uniref:glycoside hydrolase family 99-like domain-containing protein n=1 Tax=Frigoribacterium sp. UYMn621 TaxID=3156343 RepID=UPI003394D00C